MTERADPVVLAVTEMVEAFAHERHAGGRPVEADIEFARRVVAKVRLMEGERLRAAAGVL